MDNKKNRQEKLLRTIVALNTMLNKMQTYYERQKRGNKYHYLQKEWLDTQEVCEILKISPQTLKNYRKLKFLPYTKIKGKCFYRSTDIKSILLSNYREPRMLKAYYDKQKSEDDDETTN